MHGLAQRLSGSGAQHHSEEAKRGAEAELAERADGCETGGK
jgi:hypothetical protein